MGGPINYVLSDFEDYMCMVTNPPFSLFYPFLKKAYESGKPFCLLLPGGGLKTFSALWVLQNRAHGPTEVRAREWKGGQRRWTGQLCLVFR